MPKTTYFLSLLLLIQLEGWGKSVAYIHGDVAENGSIPSGLEAPYHQMLLTDTGNRGCSEFRALIEGEGYTISQHYDMATTLDASFLGAFDVVVFGLHQKIWSAAEKDTLDAWIRRGGGILMYSDSAAGGRFSLVGIKNTVGQAAVNNILSRYGMEVTVDQGGGTRSYSSESGSSNPIVWDQPIFEGEGVSPVGVDESSGAQVLIPLDADNLVSGRSLNIDTVNITNPESRTWSVIGLQQVDEGNVIAIFDRQPVWNAGEGSDINQRDNREILRRIVRYLARDYGNSSEWFSLKTGYEKSPSDNEDYLELTYRQWAGGSGEVGYDYVVRNRQFQVEYRPDLLTGDWQIGAELVEQVGPAVDNFDETQTVTVRLIPPNPLSAQAFARVRSKPVAPPIETNAGFDLYIGESGIASLSGSASGPGAVTWSQVSGPGNVAFGDASSLETTATFSAVGTYELSLFVNDGSTQGSDTVEVTVVAPGDVVAAINCGNLTTGHTGSNGFNYLADGGFTGGKTDQFPGNPVANTLDDALYNYARSQHSGYSFSVVNGNYTVYLQYAETFFLAENKRVFDTTVEGINVVDDLDLFATAPGKWVAYDRIFTTEVSDGQLDIGFSSSINNPLINAIVVIQN